MSTALRRIGDDASTSFGRAATKHADRSANRGHDDARRVGRNRKREDPLHRFAGIDRDPLRELVAVGRARHHRSLFVAHEQHTASVTRELRTERFMKIVSLAPEVL